MCQHLDSILLIEMKRSISKFMQYVDCLKLIGVFNSWIQMSNPIWQKPEKMSQCIKLKKYEWFEFLYILQIEKWEKLLKRSYE